MQMEESDEHEQKACVSIRERCEPLSNVTDERFAQSLKQPAPRLSTDAGTQIENRAVNPENADSPIRKSADPVSNITLQTQLQLAKQQLDKVTICFGIVTAPSFPKYRSTLVPPKSVKKS
jgi:hypothetical protein